MSVKSEKIRAQKIAFEDYRNRHIIGPVELEQLLTDNEKLNEIRTLEAQAKQTPRINSGSINSQQTNRINAAFDRMCKDIAKYLNTCYDNGSAVKSLSVQAANNGRHIKTIVRYHKTS
jgi:hypothetical protein